MSLADRLQHRIRETAQWTPLTVEIPTDGLAYATHEGWVPLGEDTLHVFQLNTGQVIIEQKSLETFMHGHFGFWVIFLRQHPEWEDDVQFAPDDLQGLKPGELVATTEATKAFSQWFVDQGLAEHPERVRGYLDHLDYQTTLGKQARSRRKPTLRVIRPRRQQP